MSKNTHIGILASKPISILTFPDSYSSFRPEIAGTLAGKTIVISGASQGIGRVIAQWFSRSDASLLLVARNQDKLEETRALCEPDAQSRIEILSHDLAVDPIQPTTFSEPFASPSILVSVAGSFLFKTLENTTNLQPEWQTPQAMGWIVNYVKEHPHWNISLQTHKYLDVP